MGTEEASLDRAAKQFFHECIKKLELKEGDVVLVNAAMVDVDRVAQHCFPSDTPTVSLIPVVPEQGQSLEDVVKALPRGVMVRLLRELIKDWDGIHHDKRSIRARQ